MTDNQKSEVAPAQKSGRILVADDDELSRGGLSGQLQHAGYDCACAETGHAALELLRAESFDLLIADIHMPGNAGLEMVEAVPQIAAGLPVILLTGKPSVETAARSVRLPVFAYLVKPPVKEELFALVEQAIMQYRQRRAIHASRERLQILDRELEEIERRFIKPGGTISEIPMTSFLRVTLRNIAASILDLERAANLVGQHDEAGTILQKTELVAALRHTVDVLEKTRHNFKCKDLGQLRQQLEWLLRQQYPPAQ